MKKSLIFVASLALMTTFFMWSCNKERGNPPLVENARLSTIPISPELIGPAHNTMLACFTALYQNPDSIDKSLTIFEQFGFGTGRLRGCIKMNMPSDISDSLLDHFLSLLTYTNTDGSIYFSVSQDLRIAQLLSSFSGLKNTLLTELFSLIDNATSSDDINMGLAAIEAQLDSLSDSDGEEMRAYMSVAQNSWQYWMEEGEMDNWLDLFGVSTVSSKGRSDIAKATIKGDIEGAVAGALAGAPVAGVGALAGAMIAAPLYSGWSALWAAF